MALSSLAQAAHGASTGAAGSGRRRQDGCTAQAARAQVHAITRGRDYGAIAEVAKVQANMPHGGQIIIDAATLDGIACHLTELAKAQRALGSFAKLAQMARRAAPHPACHSRPVQAVNVDGLPTSGQAVPPGRISWLTQLGAHLPKSAPRRPACPLLLSPQACHVGAQAPTLAARRAIRATGELQMRPSTFAEHSTVAQALQDATQKANDIYARQDHFREASMSSSHLPEAEALDSRCIRPPSATRPATAVCSSCLQP